MRLFFILYMSMCAMTSYAQTNIFFQCDLSDGTTIRVSEQNKKWRYQSFFKEKEIWGFNVEKKHHFVSARNIILSESDKIYKDAATLRFEHDKIHYILFKEHKVEQQKKQEEMGLLVLSPPRQKKFMCEKVYIDKFHQMLQYFPCDNKMKNKNKENICSSQ